MTERSDDRLKPAYLILSDQPAMVEMEIARIKKRAGRKVLEFSFEVFDGQQANAADIVSAANTPPFMSEMRLILIRNVDVLPASEMAAIADYLSDTTSTTCLVMTGKSLSEKADLYRAVSSAGEVIVKNVKRAAIPAMIKKGFQKRGQVPSDALAAYLLSEVGEDLAKLGSEIEKISLYCLGEKVIGLEEAKRVVSRSAETKIFELTDRIGARDIPGSIRALEQLMQTGFERKPKSRGPGGGTSGPPRRPSTAASDFRMVGKEEHAMMILYALANHFRTLLKVKALMEDGADGGLIMRELQIKGTDRTRSFLLDKYRRQCRNFAIEELKRSFELFAGADLALKSTAQPPECVLELLVTSLAAL